MTGRQPSTVRHVPDPAKSSLRLAVPGKVSNLVSEPWVLGLDLGTTTVTGVLLDAGRGEVLRQSQRRNDAGLPMALPSRAEQQPQRLRSLSLEVLAELAHAALALGGGRRLAGIALTGQKHGLLCVDASGEPLTPLISWQDQRTAEPLPDGSTVLDQIRARTADLAWQENGCRISPGYGAATLFWLIQQGQVPRGTQGVCTIAGWLASQITHQPRQGRQVPATDPTFAASWGVYNLLEEGWNIAFLDRLGLEARRFPPVQPAGERLEGLAAWAADETGLSAGLPVFNALGDTQASFLGGVDQPERALLLNLGTGGQVCWQVPQFESPTEAVEIRPLLPGCYMRVGASLCGGAAYAWLNRTVRAWLAEFGVEEDEETVYERLNTLAAACEGPGGLCVRTTFLGVRGDPAVTAGAIEGITLDNLHLGALARATLTGMVDELGDLYDSQAGRAAHRSQVVATGGGVWANPLLPGIIQQRFGLPVEVNSQRESAAVGAAMLATRAALGGPSRRNNQSPRPATLGSPDR